MLCQELGYERQGPVFKESHGYWWQKTVNEYKHRYIATNGSSLHGRKLQGVLKTQTERPLI